MKSRPIVFKDKTPCSVINFHSHFGGMYFVHLHGRRVCQARSKWTSVWWLLPACWLLDLIFDYGNGGSIFLQNIDELMPDCTVSRVTRFVVFILVTIVRSSNPIKVVGFLGWLLTYRKTLPPKNNIFITTQHKIVHGTEPNISVFEKSRAILSLQLTATATGF
jgi:hypothetical protein